MSQLIPDNNVLLQFVPNVLKSVQGETLLFDKIAPHLEVAEAWLTTTFLSEAVLAKLPHEDATNKLLHYARMAVVAEAMLHAVPQLDLVLTQNGFGVVSNTNIAPVSKERVERLLLSLEKMRDDTLSILLPLLANTEAWAISDPCKYWSQTLYPWRGWICLGNSAAPTTLGSVIRNCILNSSPSRNDWRMISSPVNSWRLCAKQSYLANGASPHLHRATSVHGGTSSQLNCICYGKKEKSPYHLA